MSSIASNIYSILTEAFPNYHIEQEHYVSYKGVRLFFDFYIKELDVLVEVQGAQHTEFVRHFHVDADGFRKYKKRDNLKIDYVQSNDKVSLVRFYHNEKFTKDLVLDRINKVFSDKEGVL